MSISSQRLHKLKNPTEESSILTCAARFSDHCASQATELLSIWGLTPLQYHALRVIYVKDSDDQGLPSKDIGTGLSTRVPDVTRLLDRMADKGWITRERDAINKRIVRSRLTQIGRELVESACQPLQALESEQLEHLSADEKHTLLALLKKALNQPETVE